MRSIGHPDFEYRPWSEERRQARIKQARRKANDDRWEHFFKVLDAAVEELKAVGLTEDDLFAILRERAMARKRVKAQVVVLGRSSLPK